MTKVCPCKHCVPPKRHLHCHSGCKEYHDWCKEKEQERKNRDEFVEEENFYRTVHHRRYTKK